MKLYAHKLPFGHWLAALLGLHPARPAEPKPVKQKPRPRHRHAAFFELP
jgi:hypothetical protein